MKKTLKLAAIPLLLSGLLIAPANLPSSCDCSSSCEASSVHAAEVNTAHLQLKGLTCAACKFAVKGALNNLDGVEQADVDYEKRRATIDYDPGRVTPQQMIEAIEKAGFRAEVLPDSATD